MTVKRERSETVGVILNFNEVCRLLPQAYPFIMIDVVEELQPGKRIVCRKNVSGNEWMMPGHFPGNALFPGALIIEGMAQSAILLVRGDSTQNVAENTTYMLAGVKTRFLKPVVPGDQIHYVCEALTFASMGGVVDAEVFVDGEIVAKGQLTFAISRT